ncbi:unnamed protein product [Pedinophyceae sp. YPF-701]|nr:unnamed protein product [Pedinophyceae sp. YPF-701]
MFGSLGADKTVGGDSYDAGDVASERVSDTQKGASGGLVDYLALPVEQYSVLDPTWVSRPEGAPPGCFRLTVPLRDLAGVELEPTLLIRAGYVPEKTRVVLESVESSFGSPQWDAYASVSLKASLTRVDVADADDADRWLGQPESARSGAPTVDSDGVIDVEPIDNVRDADAPPVAGLRCSVEVLVDVRVPQSLRIVPGVVLRGAGSTILRAAMGVLLPSFLDLLAADYRRWATRSQPRDLPAGNLLPADAKLGEAPSANEDSPSSQS